MKVVNVVPMGAPRLTRADAWKGRPVVQRYHEYRDALREALPGFELPVELRVVFFIPMPASWSRRKRFAFLGAPHDQKPDIDNLVKAFMDAFKSEDKHVAILHAEKYWSEVGEVSVDVEEPSVWNGDDLWPEHPRNDPQVGAA